MNERDNKESLVKKIRNKRNDKFMLSQLSGSKEKSDSTAIRKLLTRRNQRRLGDQPAPQFSTIVK